MVGGREHLRPHADTPSTRRGFLATAGAAVAEEIDLCGRDSASGTFGYFAEAINGGVGNVRNDYSASADTNVTVSAQQATRGSRPRS